MSTNYRASVYLELDAGGFELSRIFMTREAETAVFADATNFPHPHLRDLVEADLDDEFRAPSRTVVPALMVADDLDDRTPLEEPQVAAAQFSRGEFVEVRNASYNDGFDPQSQDIIFSFLSGAPTSSRKIASPPLKFGPEDRFRYLEHNRLERPLSTKVRRSPTSATAIS